MERRSSYWRQRIANHVVIALANMTCAALFWELFSSVAM
jgi:hypothetical protein